MDRQYDSWIEKMQRCAEPDSAGWMSLSQLNLAEAEALLDWLQDQSVGETALDFDPEQGFIVRWRGSSAEQDPTPPKPE